MMSTWLVALLTFLGTLATGTSAAWFLIRANRRQIYKSTDADYAKKVTEQYDKLAMRLNEQVTELTRQLAIADAETERQRVEMERQRLQLICLQQEVAALRAELVLQKAENQALSLMVNRLQAQSQPGREAAT